MIKKIPKLTDTLSAMANPTCPWWLCFTFDNPARKLVHNPYKILSAFVKKGDTVLDIGPGMGYFTFPLSKIIGSSGHVFALDIQQEMLNRLERKVIRNGAGNIKIKLYDGNKFNLDEKFDFALLFWMYHEVRNKPVFINEIKSVMKTSAKILIVEPKIHVTQKAFDESISLLTGAGFKVVDKPAVSLSRSAVLQKI